jgi:hypothetical protein
VPDQTGYADAENKVLPPLVGSGSPQSYLIVANSTTPNQVVAANAAVAWQLGIAEDGPFLSVEANQWFPIRLTQQYTTVWVVVPAQAQLTLTVNEVIASQGPPGPAGTGSAQQSAVNDYPGTIYGGQPLAPSVYGGVTLAQADELDLRCIGFAAGMTAHGDSVSMALAGPLTMSSWATVCGSPTLESGALYFLDDSAPGRITTTAPTAPGTIAQQIGTAFGVSTLLVLIGPPVQN